MRTRLAVALTLLAPSLAQAQGMVDCATLPNVVYFQVGDTQEPLMKALGRQLRDSTVRPITIVYTTAGSCTNIETIVQGTPVTANMRYVPSTAEDSAWTPAAASRTCRPPAGGAQIQVANSALLLGACTQTPLPNTLGAFVGAVQPYVFVVPAASSQTAITAEEAYFVFGFGAPGQVEPWTNESLYFIRDTTRSTLLALAANIRVPGARWKGTVLMRSADVVTAVGASVEPERTIGILGAEIYDRNRNTLRSLAFRTFRQKRAYYPDSTPTSRDKLPTRKGLYVPWSPTIYLTAVDAQGVPTNSDAGYAIDLIVGRPPAVTPDFDPLRTVINQGLVPECAMEVQRQTEGGDLSPFQPPEPCGCFFESVVGGAAPASCTACAPNNPCAQGTCRHGFCEAR